MSGSDRAARATAHLLVAVLTAGCASGHALVHSAINDQVTDQLAKAGLKSPEPVAEALEYIALDDEKAARKFVAQAHQENSPTEIKIAVKILGLLAPSLGPYGKHVKKAVDLLEGAGGDETAHAAGGKGSPGACPDVNPNLGHAGENCARSPDCAEGLGCVAGLCTARGAVVASESPADRVGVQARGQTPGAAPAVAVAARPATRASKRPTTSARARCPRARAVGGRSATGRAPPHASSPPTSTSASAG
jgi:hypothetical protein